MKFSILAVALLASSAAAFAPATSQVGLSFVMLLFQWLLAETL
jgi:hypothetical protein